MSSELKPEINAANAAYWDGLSRGELRYQSCRHCGHRWLPARSICPGCLKEETEWRTASGRGTLKSWVVYHVAYHPSFERRVPYNVALVELEEGPRLLTNILGEAPRLRGDAPVRLQVETNGNVPLATFVLDDSASQGRSDSGAMQ